MIQGDYPYMYARVSAKRAKLYDEADYENMLKMGPNEISRKMGEGAYKSDIDQLGSKYDGVRLVELALAKNLAREMSELADMANGKLQKVIEIYLRRYDILTYKRILRAKKSNEDINDYLTPVGGVSYEEIEKLSDKNFEQVRDSIKFSESEIDYRGYIEDVDSLAEIEKALDQAYYDELSLLAKGSGNKALENFIKEEAEYENFKIVLRMKRYDLSEEDIRTRLMSSKDGKRIEELLQMDFESGLEFVISELDLSVDPQIESVEHSIEVHRLENALRMLHTQPLTLSSILGYVVAKITEVKNLRMMLRAKETGIQNQETIRKQLVLAN
ncbi:MAG: V-type ATPase subunit [Candidatus Nanohaloarchaea archaeon]